MKVVIELGPTLYDRVRTVVDRGQFRSLTEFAALAIENQLALEVDGFEGDALRQDSPGAIQRLSPANVSKSGPEPERLAPTSAAALTVAEHGWLWGIVNRILPIKFATRYLQNATQAGLIPFEVAKRDAANEAEGFARQLVASASKDRDRHDRLVTGFPLREPIYPAKLRFGNHYFGRLERSGETRGALFELGLAGVTSRAGKSFVGLTSIGFDFAKLYNPVLDTANHQAQLSHEEVNCYVTRVVPSVRRELDCFLTLLGVLDEGAMGVDQLDAVVHAHLGKQYSKAALQTQKAGALGRLRDLGLIARTKEGVTARFTITPTGKKAFDELRELRLTSGGG